MIVEEKKYRDFDAALLVTVFAIFAFGLLSIYSATPSGR
jgi:cell division protein FtsW (lipid II flippase)